MNGVCRRTQSVRPSSKNTLLLRLPNVVVDLLQSQRNPVRVSCQIRKFSTNNNNASSSFSTTTPNYKVLPGLDQQPQAPPHKKFGGEVIRRMWAHRNPYWCNLCQEPIAAWNMHVGKKDHSLLESHYNAIGRYESRNWEPAEVLQDFEYRLGGVKLKSLQEKVNDEDVQRRKKLLLLTKYLIDEKLVVFGPERASRSFVRYNVGITGGIYNQGSMALYSYIIAPLLRLFPDADVGTFASFEDFLMCTYNMETVYDVCGFRALDEEGGKKFPVTSPQASGIGGLNAAALSFERRSEDELEDLEGGEEGREQDVSGDDDDDDDLFPDGSPEQPALSRLTRIENAPAAFSMRGGARRPKKSAIDKAKEERQMAAAALSHKSDCIRGLLAQLWWCMKPNAQHPEGKQIPHHLIEIGKQCAAYICHEVVLARVCEYTIRADPIWMQHGLEQPSNLPSRRKMLAVPAAPPFVSTSYRPMEPWRGDQDDLYSIVPTE